MTCILYFYIKDGKRIEVTDYQRSALPDKVITVSNANGFVSIEVSINGKV